MRLLLISLFVVTSISVTGCLVVDAGKEMTKSTFDLMQPNPRDYDDADPIVDEDWGQYGQDARADRPTEKLNDPLNKWTLSDKARSIERSVGFEYQ